MADWAGQVLNRGPAVSRQLGRLRRGARRMARRAPNRVPQVQFPLVAEDDRGPPARLADDAGVRWWHRLTDRHRSPGTGHFLLHHPDHPDPAGELARAGRGADHRSQRAFSVRGAPAVQPSRRQPDRELARHGVKVAEQHDERAFAPVDVADHVAGAVHSGREAEIGHRPGEEGREFPLMTGRRRYLQHPP